MSKQQFKIIETKKIPHSEVEITGEIPADVLTEYRAKAIKSLTERVEFPGFRKGKVPENMLVSKVGEMGILEEAAEMAMYDITPAILIESKLEYITQPSVSITKLAPANPVEFKLKVAVMPEIKVPDYKKIAKEEMKKEVTVLPVTDDDVQKVIDDIQKRMAPLPEKDGDEVTLPEVTDEFVKKLGEFKDVADFKVQIKENIIAERDHRTKEKKRLTISENLVAEAKIDLPETFVEQELAIMLARFKDDITKMGLKFDEYLKHIKKTEEDLRKDWRSDAEKKASLELILAQIAKEEKIKPEQEKIDHETKHLIEHYPGVDTERAKAYITKQLTQDLVFNFLEEQK